MALDTSGISVISTVPIAALVVRWLVFPGILGTAVLSVAMWYFWFSFDRSSWAKKMMWFLPLYLLLGIGPVCTTSSSTDVLKTLPKLRCQRKTLVACKVQASYS